MPDTRSSTSEAFTEEMKRAMREIVDSSVRAILDTALAKQSDTFTTSLAAATASIAALTSEVADLKTRLSQRDHQILQLKNRIEELESAEHGDTTILQTRIDQLEHDHDALEQYGRRLNIRLDNVPELPDETPAKLEQRALEILNAAGAAVKSTDIIRMHRMGQLRPHPDQPHAPKRGQVILRLNNWAARESAHLARNNSRTKGHPIRQDLTKIRRELIAEANAAIREWGALDEPVYCYANINCLVTMRCGRNTEKIHGDADLKEALRRFKPHA